jgi:Flp pilus assembly pilin Flp
MQPDGAALIRHQPSTTGGRMPIGLLRRFAGDEGGATAIEYTFLAALIGLTIIVAMSNVGHQVVQGMLAVAAGFP